MKKRFGNGVNKGKRVERNLCTLLTTHFKQPFIRVVGSGNRWSQVNAMPIHAVQALTGDICTPVGFKWSIECKGGYVRVITIPMLQKQRCKLLDTFIEQAITNAHKVNKLPIIMWKRDYQPWLAIVHKSDVPSSMWEMAFCSYKGYVVILLEHLLQLPSSYWFAE